MTANSWDGLDSSCQKKPQRNLRLIQFISRFRSILCWWKSQIQVHMLKKFTEPFKLNSQNSVGYGIVRKPQWEIPVSEQPYKLLSVKFQGKCWVRRGRRRRRICAVTMPLEEFVHCDGRALKAEPVDGDQGGPISWSKTPPLVKLRGEELEIRSLSTFAPTW